MTSRLGAAKKGKDCENAETDIRLRGARLQRKIRCSRQTEHQWAEQNILSVEGPCETPNSRP